MVSQSIFSNIVVNEINRIKKFLATSKVSVKGDSWLLLLWSYLYCFCILQIPLVHFHLLDSLEVVSEFTYWKTHWWYLYQLMVFCRRADLIFLMPIVPCYPLFCIKYLCFLSYFSISKCIRGYLVTSVYSQCCWFTNRACFKSSLFC